MGELKILGAQRVKALQKILEDKEREVLKTVQEIGNKELVDSVDDLIIGENTMKRYRELKEEIMPIEKELNEARRKNEWFDAKKELLKPFQDERDAIKKEFAEKKNNLWLCETMEEAKEIVGI